MSALKFGDPASIAQKEQARICEARLESKREFPDSEIHVLLQWEDELSLADTYKDRVAMVRGWLDRHFENKE